MKAAEPRVEMAAANSAGECDGNGAFAPLAAGAHQHAKDGGKPLLQRIIELVKPKGGSSEQFTACLRHSAPVAAPTCAASCTRDVHTVWLVCTPH